MAIRTGQPVFASVEADSPTFPAALEPILAGEQCGTVVRGVLEPAAAARLVAALGAGEGAPPPIASRYYKGASYGSILAVAEGLDGYFAAARELNAWLEADLARELRLRSRLLDVLGRLCGPRALTPPEAVDGRDYALVTVRVYEPGSEIGVHSEKVWPTMAALAQQADLTRQISFYLVLQQPERGGQLTVYGRPPAGQEPDPRRQSRDQLLRAFEAFGVASPELAVGDLVLFDGGRHNHRVTPVEGPLARWTLGGFVALGSDHDRVLVWS